MRALWIRKHGGPDVLEVRESPDPEVTPGHVRIQVRAAGLNFAEVMARQGIYPAAPKPPCVVGYEGAGVIDQVGEGVGDLAEGQRAMFISRFGGHSSVVVVPRHQVVPIPDGLDFEHAAAMPVNYLTAHQMLFRVRRIIPGDRVLIHAAAGGVGTAALQLCRMLDGPLGADAPDNPYRGPDGARRVTTFGTASAAKHDYVRAQGCDHPIDYRSVDYVEVVRELTAGDGVDLVCDPLGGADWQKGYSLLRPGGVLICFGFANGAQPGRRNLFKLLGQLLKVRKFNPMDMMGHNRAVAGVDLGSLWEHEAHIHDGLRQIVAYWEAGHARPHLDGVFPFREATEAFGRLEHGRNMGKVVLTPDG